MGANKKNNNNNNNKARRKHDVQPVLLGVPDGRVEHDTDAYVTKLGGVPIWLQPDTPPSKSVCTCKNCGQLQYLIFQGYVPLPESIYHRVIYVWACNRRECMRKPTRYIRYTPKTG
ncbi:hypothetical protein BCR43DRAFT_430779 [Syncephalastrum racemosum]|uniref:Programmed cell death protein 2 n=1 Tax=Syncephalastrum racemosum TaxID=13706 RepID=A0A1X2HW73_SYNRA|nr:hypothetical protein BCR43DRAFT_430779 [Syncephalastrum racemosum]